MIFVISVIFGWGIVWECVVSRRKRYLLCVLSTFNAPQSVVSFFVGSMAYVVHVQSKYWTCPSRSIKILHAGNRSEARCRCDEENQTLYKYLFPLRYQFLPLYRQSFFVFRECLCILFYLFGGLDSAELRDVPKKNIYVLGRQRFQSLFPLNLECFGGISAKAPKTFSRSFFESARTASPWECLISAYYRNALKFSLCRYSKNHERAYQRLSVLLKG